MDLPFPSIEPEHFRRAAAFLAEAVNHFGAVGLEVQTTRLAGPALDAPLQALSADEFQAWAASVESAGLAAGLRYLALGRVPGNRDDVVEHFLAPLIAGGEIVSLSADLLDAGRPSVKMARASARACRALADATEGGLGNFRFAATASGPAGVPFLPSAYHAGGPPAFSIGVQAADVVQAALTEAGSLVEVEERLIARIEASTQSVVEVARALEASHRVRFLGIDYSPAPFPAAHESICAAIEALGVDRFGAPGTLIAATLITRAIRRAAFPRVGFCGLMLPVLEDAVLALRVAEHPPSIHDLLLYSAVCGTGLDTVPLPGAVSEATLAGIYLDVAALSVAQGGKPLTARLFPIPALVAGEATAFDFPYFANSRTLGVGAAGAAGILEREGLSAP